MKIDVPFTNYRSGATGIYFRSRKFTLNEGQSNEARGYQSFYGCSPVRDDELDTTEAFVSETRSEIGGHPFALRIATPKEGYVAEGGKQVAELLLMLIDQASYAEGIPPEEYAARLFQRTNAQL